MNQQVQAISARQLNRNVRVNISMQFLDYCRSIELGGALGGRALCDDETRTRQVALETIRAFCGGEIGNPDDETLEAGE